MTGKNKRFPLTLSSVVDKPGPTGRAPAPKPVKPVATPQTATQNAAQNAARQVAQRAALPVTPTSNAPERSHALVSDAVRRAMVMRVAQQGVKDEKVLGAMQAVPRHMFLDP